MGAVESRVVYVFGATYAISKWTSEELEAPVRAYNHMRDFEKFGKNILKPKSSVT